MEQLLPLWDSLFIPMFRLLMGISLGLLIANILEALRWTKYLARFAAPLSRAAHLSDISGAAFSMAFVSPMSANTLLSEKYEQGEMPKREVILSNIFNSLPTILTHTPTIFFMLWPILGFPTCIYVGLTLAAAFLRTALTVLVGALFLPKRPEGCVPCHLDNTPFSWKAATQKAWKMFRRRFIKLLYFTIPIYILMYMLQQYGFFDAVERWMALHATALSFLEPEAMGIIALYMAAELGAALSAAGFALHDGLLSERAIVMALLVGNILSTPMRGIRHQFPAYAGFYKPKLALQLILTNQGLRATSMVLMTIAYYYASA